MAAWLAAHADRRVCTHPRRYPSARALDHRWFWAWRQHREACGGSRHNYLFRLSTLAFISLGVQAPDRIRLSAPARTTRGLPNAAQNVGAGPGYVVCTYTISPAN